MHKRFFGVGLFTLAVAATGAVGCSSSSNNNGTLQQGWTIAGAQNPAACTAANATQMRLVVIDPNAVVTATQFANCTDFQIVVSLPPNTYTAAATFLNANGLAVSRTLVLPAFSISSDNTTTQTVNFAPGDFL